MLITDTTWQRLRELLDSNLVTFAQMDPAEPMPTAKWCRESPHRTLGHLTSCQSAWLPLMRQLRDGAERGSIPINPDPLFLKLGFASLSWEDLLEQFRAQRREWTEIVDSVAKDREIQTARRIWNVRTLTRRLVLHERKHLDDLKL